MMYWYGSGMSGWGYALMTVSLILFWGAVVFGIVMLVRSFGRGSQPPAATQAPKAPQTLLAERFARGEIGDEEYGQRLSVLRGTDQCADSRTLAPVGDERT